MVPEASLARSEHGLRPVTEGWFVVNARETRWFDSGELGRFGVFDSLEARFDQVGIGIGILRPGEPNCMYHAEEMQEDFLVVSGECLLIVEGEERPLEAWDFVHCPPWTEHVFVGAGDGPCVVVGAEGSSKGPWPPLSGQRDGAEARCRRRAGDVGPRRRVREVWGGEGDSLPRRAALARRQRGVDRLVPEPDALVGR